jgi:hypothetical protein
VCVSENSLKRVRATKCTGVHKNAVGNIEATSRVVKPGKIFGRWLVLRAVRKTEKNTFWLCECQCDKRTLKVLSQNHLAGNGGSCGCVVGEKRIFDVSMSSAEGVLHRKLYKAWHGMLSRVYDTHNKSYCGQCADIQRSWHKLEKFAKDVGLPPGKNFKLARYDRFYGFRKENVSWVEYESRKPEGQIEISLWK